MIFDQSHILVNTQFKNKEDLFILLGKKAKEKQIGSDEKIITEAFLKREKEGTTGFEDGFAIPHARVIGVKKPSLFVIQNKENFQNWKALDQKGVRYAIALMIPEKAGSLHMDLLSKIATKLMDQNFRNLIKTGDKSAIFKAFDALIKSITKVAESVTKENKNKEDLPLLIGISACPAGIAHTFMAKQKMENSAKELNMAIKWETQGAKGQENKLNKEDIEKAKIVIIASDIDLDLTRFKGKKIFITNTNDAIKNGTSLIKKAQKESKIFDGKVNQHKNIVTAFFSNWKKAFQSSFNTPWIYLSISAAMLAFISLIGFASYGQDWNSEGQSLNLSLFKIQEIAKFALYLSMPIMAATIAKKATNHGEAFAITLVATLILNMPSIMTGFHVITNGSQENINLFYDWNGVFASAELNHGSNILGAIIVTFVVIIMIKNIKKIEKWLISKKQKNAIAKIIVMGFSPWLDVLLTSVVTLVLIVFTFGAPLAWVSSQVTYFLIDYAQNYWWLRFIIGGLLGVGIAYDLGGIVNKISLITLIGFAQYDLRFAALISVGIPLASIGYGTTYYVFKNRFSKEDAQDGAESFRKGLNGMTEGPLFLTHKYGLRVMIPNLVSTFIATGLTLVLGLYIFKGGHLGILFLGAQADLAHANDIWWLNTLLPQGKGIITALCSIAYGIIGYYLVMMIGTFTYVSLAALTFNYPGKKQIFQKITK